MKPLLILNDCHIGVKRSAGTTPASALALRRYLLDSFRSLLPDDKDVLVLGDLFDDLDGVAGTHVGNRAAQDLGGEEAVEAFELLRTVDILHFDQR